MIFKGDVLRKKPNNAHLKVDNGVRLLLQLIRRMFNKPKKNQKVTSCIHVLLNNLLAMQLLQGEVVK